jgi:signal transduction histidine kinase
MFERGGRGARLVLGGAVAVLALVQIEQFAQTIRWQARLHAQAVRAAEAPLRPLLLQLGGAVQQGPGGWGRALSIVGGLYPSAEAEIFDAGGRSLISLPRPAPVEHWLDAAQREALKEQRFLTVGPVGGNATRLLTYVSFPGAAETTLRVSQPVPELVEDLRERRQVLMGQGFAVLGLLLSALLIVSPLRGRPEAASTPRALDAYVEAMSRLRQHEQDQTQQHEAERLRLEERIRVAEPMARAGELTAGIVHEVRNGLGTIVGYARLVEKRAAEAEARDAAVRIRAECETLETVVRRFIEFVKAERLTLDSFDLGRTLARVAARESAAGPGARVTIAPAGAMELVGDEELLERALENIVRNGREAAGPHGHVDVRALLEAGQVVVAVSDDGPGLSAEQRDALRPFVTTKPGGLGLGLPLALKIIRLHDGDLAMSSRQPRGLVVTVRLPAAGPEAPAGKGPAAA